MKSQDKLVSLSKHPFGNQGCFKSELKTPLPVKADRDLDRTHWLCKDWNRTGQSLALIPEGLETRMEWGNTWISLVVSVSHTGVLYVTNAHLGKPEDQSLALEPVLREENTHQQALRASCATSFDHLICWERASLHGRHEDSWSLAFS